MKKTLILFLIPYFLTFTLSNSNAQDISFNGSLSTQAGAGLSNTHDNKGKFLTQTTVFDGTIKTYMDESMGVINAQLVLDSLNSQSSNGREALVSEDGSASLKLKEAYYDYNGTWWALRAGRQINAWGKADEIQITDILCPQDNATIVASEYKDNRIGVDALRLSLISDQVQGDVYWIPIFTPSTLPLSKNNPLRPILFPAKVEGTSITYFNSINDLELPEKKLANSEYALRLTAYLPIMDFSLYGFSGWDDLPLTSVHIEDEVIIKGTYERLFMVGADAAIPIGDFVVRLESAFFPQRHFQVKPEYQAKMLQAGEECAYSEKENQMLALAGFDWDAGNGFTITAQYVADVLVGTKEKLDTLERKEYEHTATLSVDKSLCNDNLSLSLSGAVDLNQYSSVYQLSTSYKLSDSIKLSAIGDVFLEGPDNKAGKYGIYRDLSCITLKGVFSF